MSIVQLPFEVARYFLGNLEGTLTPIQLEFFRRHQESPGVGLMGFVNQAFAPMGLVSGGVGVFAQ